jgi:hypothetical protein
MGQVFIGGIQRMVDDYGRRIIENATVHLDIPVKKSRLRSELLRWTTCEDVDSIARAKDTVRDPTSGKDSARSAFGAATAAESRNSDASGGRARSLIATVAFSIYAVAAVLP